MFEVRVPLSFANPQYLVETDWLSAHLSDPELRIFDCTTYLDPDPKLVYTVRSGRPDWENGHIPGADFLDVQAELSEAASPFRFTFPSERQFVDAMSRHGVGPGCRVVLYCSDRPRWATRVWWLLRAFGFDDAAVLNGGLDKWKQEGRPLSTGSPRRQAARFVARPRPALIADKAQVIAAMSDPSVCLINSLTPEQFTGEGGTSYGRPGHIPGSVNVPSVGLVDGTKRFRPATELASQFAAAGADRANRIITYCGGGIAASMDTYALCLLGYENVALYDGSLSEWNADPSLPMETGPAVQRGAR